MVVAPVAWWGQPRSAALAHRVGAERRGTSWEGRLVAAPAVAGAARPARRPARSVPALDAHPDSTRGPAGRGTAGPIPRVPNAAVAAGPVLVQGAAASIRLQTRQIFLDAPGLGVAGPPGRRLAVIP